MTTAELRVLARAGLLHDIGKSGIPDQILGKHSPLDEAEWTLVRSHPEIGLSILETRGSKRELLAVLYHHERLDGSGYPYGLPGGSKTGDDGRSRQAARLESGVRVTRCARLVHRANDVSRPRHFAGRLAAHLVSAAAEI
jgi:hypothetical protein